MRSTAVSRDNLIIDSGRHSHPLVVYAILNKIRALGGGPKM